MTWTWVDLGALPDVGWGGAEFGVVTADGSKVFYTSDGDGYVYSADYPSLTSANTNSDGGWLYTYVTPSVSADNITRSIRGMTLSPSDGMLYVLVERTDSPGTEGGAEIWEFDTANPSDAGTVVFYDPDDLGSNTGMMRGHIAYNPTDDRIYIAESYGHFDFSVSNYYTALASVDRTTWTRTDHRTYYTPDGHHMRGSIAITDDGAVWYVTYVDSSNESLHRYDPAADTDASVASQAYGYTVDPLAFDNVVLLVAATNPWTAIHRYTHAAGAITEDTFADADAAAVADWPGYWYGTYDGHFFEGSHIWTFSTGAAPTLGPTVGYIGPGLMA